MRRTGGCERAARPVHRAWAEAGARLLGILSWAVLGTATAVDSWLVLEASAVTPTVLPLALIVLFGFMVSRLVLGAVARPERWPGLLAVGCALLGLVTGLVVWSASTAPGTASGAAVEISFPSPGEGFFAVAYLGFAAYLVLEGDRFVPSRVTVLNTMIICGGTACLAGFVLVTPAARAFGREGLPLLVALVYPLLDTVLLLVVVGQIVLRVRPLDGRAIRSAVAFFLLGVADTYFVVGFVSGAYEHQMISTVTWAAALLLLVGTVAGDGHASPDASAPRRSWEGLAVQSAAAIALVVLVIEPAPAIRPYVVIPAVITLLAVAVRMTVAIHQARDVNDAFRLARTDDLTGLPNRRAMDSWIDEGLRDGTPMGVLLLGLDGFKEINDTLGHTAGDVVLGIVAGRISEAAGPGARTARLSGDEFVVLLPHGDPEEHLATAQALRAAVRQPARADEMEITVSASVGVALRDGGVRTGGDLLRRADVAMYQAKNDRAGVMLYDPARDDFSRERLQIVEELRSGIERGELVPWYQPQVDAVDGTVRSVEALVRWMHPTRGVLAPGVFLPAARRAGLMGPLTDLMLELVVDDAKQWRAQGLDLQVSVNVAPAELLSAGTVKRLLAQVEASGLPPRALAIEVTEDSFLTDPVLARDMIEQLVDCGLDVSIDDYGTGFSSLSYLRDLPVQELKIDRAFVAPLLADPRSAMIVSATTQLARGLGLRTVAEGVEDEETAFALRDIGVDLLQGFHFARPMPPAEVSGWMADQCVGKHVGEREVRRSPG
ncbi:MAG: diguanylate cyclase [Actinomycetota bacterium]|nr:diguanylate cyclase [Actinomycetota bacterium]